MNEETIQLEFPVLLPDLPDGCAECLGQLKQMLENRRGIERVHVSHDADPAHLCLHFDPDLVSLADVQRIARATGSDFSARYRHERLAITGMDVADAAPALARLLEALPGMLHASVNYAAGLVFVAYDTQKLTHAQVEEAIHDWGYQVADESADLVLPIEEQASQESLSAFLPAWLQARRQLLLVGLTGIFFLIGWLGGTFFGLSENAAVFFFILAYITGGYDIATHAIPGLFRGQFDTDVLMMAAAGGAAILGHWAEGAFLLFLFSLGHAGENYALDRARNAVNALGQLMPKTALVKQGDQIVSRPVESLALGEVVVVRPGDRLPADGEVAHGRSAIDQSAITGESVPVNKEPGNQVFAGTVNTQNALEVTVTRLAQDSTLSRVMQMVAEAQEQQSPSQRFSQRFASKFVPAILILVALVAIVPPLLGWASWSESFYRSMLLLVAASPCALALGTPAAVLAGIAQAARNGVLIKGGAHLENLGTLQVMAFDKTGTLTEGRFTVTDIVSLNGASPDEVLRLAAAVEQQSNHPLALAVVRTAQERGLALPAADGLVNLPGHGVRSKVDGRPVLIGSTKLFGETAGLGLDAATRQAVEHLEDGGKTTMIVSHADQFLGLLALADTPHPAIRQTMAELLSLGVQKLVMLTGDSADVARRISAEVGVTDVRTGLMPEQKLEAVRGLQEEYGDIAMVGDGVNDAPALASATVGIAMGGAGTAVALETADVALMADDLSRLPFAVGLGRASRAIIRQNLAIALGVIGLLVLTSVLGLIQLGGAVLLHEGSTILVVFNALRLLRYER
ncbi:MAG TPA: heavy metal translocating P-type ATPase [Anaerolineae bacterium]|jgi:Cd2+/Zn2+-exporting ATPase|nr:heavy metal translocating P-type ATPase [Anaerolineae bacterium]